MILAGPVFGTWISRRLDLPVPPIVGGDTREDGVGGSGPAHTGTDLGGVTDSGQRTATTGTAVEAPARQLPGLAATIATVLLPVVLMLLRAIGELTLDEGNGLRSALDVLGTPVIALLAGAHPGDVHARHRRRASAARRSRHRRRLAAGDRRHPADRRAPAAGSSRCSIDAGVGDMVGPMPRRTGTSTR